jgi:hypothetical protein
MQTKEITYNKRGIGDCDLARGHETYGLFFDTSKEAKAIAMDVYSFIGKEKMTKPIIIITHRKTSRTMGTANRFTGRIRLNNNGANVGCLLHELAHLIISSSGAPHGYNFKTNQGVLLVWWQENRDKYIGIDVKVKRTTSNLNRIKKIVNNSFERGDRVWWMQKKYGKVEGTITRINMNTVTVKNLKGNFIPSGCYFRVSPGLLHHVGGHFELPKTPVIKPMKKDDIGKILADAKKVAADEKVVDTDEEIHDMITGLMDGLQKYAVHDSLAISGIVKCMWVNGVKNTDINRKIALDYVKDELGLKIR